MELTQLKYFLNLCETEHVTRSAQRLNIAQPALTQAMRRLEQELNVPLFARSGRNIALTEYGCRLRDRLVPLAEEFRKIPDELATMADLKSATVHLNVLAASSLVAEAIAEYLKKRESVRFRMTQWDQEDLCDIGITTRLPQPSDPGIGYVCAEKIFMAVPAASKYAALREVALADLAEEGFISLVGSRALRQICDGYCLRAGFVPRVIFESDNPGAVRSMIAANMGVGFWPEFTWGTIDTDRVRLLPIKNPDCRREIVITRRDNKQDSAEVAHFHDFLIGVFESRRGTAD